MNKSNFVPILLCAFAILILNGRPASAETCASSEKDCSYYACKERQLGCGKTGYLLRFGRHYCEAYKRSERIYSSNGQIWLRGIRDCLQRELELVRELSCESVKRIAIETHAVCYVRFNFCELSIYDQALIGVTAFKEVFDPDIRPFILETLKCEP